MKQAHELAANLKSNAEHGLSLAVVFGWLALYLAGLPAGWWLASIVTGAQIGEATLFQAVAAALITIAVEGVWVVVYHAVDKTFLT